jgi:glyoxylase-like metal-dependent hydrolase (beta-lactamase superfamily II)
VTSHLGSLSAPSSVRRRQFDDVTLTYIVDGAMSMVPSAFLPDIPADYWRDHPGETDDAGHLAMSTGGLLVQRGDHCLLIDTGFGPVQIEASFGRVDCGAFLQTLAAVGVAAEDVDVVALTHLHPDHIGWLFTTTGGDDLTPVFPRAAYTLAAAEWAPYGGGDEAADSPDVRRVVSGLRRHPWLRVVADGEEIAPGVTAVVTPGHSSGHTSYIVTSAQGRRVIAFGDAFHAPAQLSNPQWGSAPDTDPAAVPAARRRLTAELLEPDSYGFAIHFGDQPFGRVRSDDDGTPRWEPIATDVLAPPPTVGA